MRKIVGVVMLMAVLAFGSFGMAQKFGVYTGYGYDGLIGGQYYSGNLRLSVGITPIVGFGVMGSVDYIFDKIALSDEEPISFYYGAGAGAGFMSFLGVSGFMIQGHGLGGIMYDLSNSNMSLFAELGVGPEMLMIGSYTGFTFGYDVKFGVTFK